MTALLIDDPANTALCCIAILLFGGLLIAARPKPPSKPCLILALLLSVPAMGQTPYGDCGYSAEEPTWAQVRSCKTIEAGTTVLTDIIIKGDDTTRLREVVILTTWRYMVAQHVYQPANDSCPPVICHKIIKCLR